MPGSLSNIPFRPFQDNRAMPSPDVLASLPPEHVFKIIWHTDPGRMKRLMKDSYNQNEQTRFMLGKTNALQHHLRSGGSTLPEKCTKGYEDRNFVILLASLSAARKLYPNLSQCYCQNHACAGKVNCATLTTLFAAREEEVKSLSDCILKETYNAADPEIIKLIRENDRLRNRHPELIKNMRNIQRRLEALPKGKKGRARRVALSAQLQFHVNKRDEIIKNMVFQ